MYALKCLHNDRHLNSVEFFKKPPVISISKTIYIRVLHRSVSLDCGSILYTMISGGDIPIPEAGGTECAIHIKDSVCSRKKEVAEMRKFLKKQGANVNIDGTNEEIVAATMNYLDVDTEAAIYQHPMFKRFVGKQLADGALRLNFKPKMPGVLLDNYSIDDKLEEWSRHSQDVFGKKFYHVPFQMIDFAEKKTELTKIDIPTLKKEGYDCFAVVFNTDVSSGRGKHWFCVYGDLAHAGTEADPLILEYFNSSGFPPAEQITRWMAEVAADALLKHGLYIDTHQVSRKRLQYSRTECGMWSIFYIMSRLDGKPPDYFYKVSASDDAMLELRHHLFRQS